MYPKGGIAFFDSGIGGLTTLSSCVDYAQAHNLGGINYYYYGDNFHAPYGNLSEGQIFSYVDEIFSRFKSLEVSAAVLACNTATAVCAERLREKYTFPIIGLEPAILPAAKEGGAHLLHSVFPIGVFIVESDLEFPTFTEHKVELRLEGAFFVICDGGGNVSVKNAVTEILTRLFGISGSRISVNEIGK